MNTQPRLPYLLLGVGDTAPACCIIFTNGTDKRPSIRRTLFRRPGEDDYAFWNRVEAEARQLADPFDMYPRSGRIEFDYERTSAEDDGDNGDARFNKRMELRFWCYSDNAEIRVMAASALWDMHAETGPGKDTPEARH